MADLQLTDDELLAIADKPELVSQLNDAERVRLGRLRATEPRADVEADNKHGSGTSTALMLAAREAPAAGRATVRATGRFAAKHPSATQKIIGASVRAVGGSIGASVGGVPGAIAGASVAGVTPKQETIRYVGGRMAGETPTIAREAGRAVGIQNYVKSTSGIKINPSDVLARSRGLPAAEEYAKAQGRELLKILGPNGEVVVGPTAVPEVASRTRGVAQRIASNTGAKVSELLPLLARLQAAVGVTDFAQAVEPTRRDIGVMGIGASRPDPVVDEGRNDANIAAMNQRLAEQAAERGALIEELLSLFGLR